MRCRRTEPYRRSLHAALLLLLCAVPTACASSSLAGLRPDAAAYLLTDTATYANELHGGEYALLRRNGVVIDSVDLALGMARLNNGAVLFLPVEPVASDVLPDAMDITEYVLFDGRRRVPLRAALPDFNDYFSSPNVIDGILYYWAWEATDGRESNIFARRFDAHLQRVDSCFLYRDLVATDFRWHFVPPMAAGTKVRYLAHDFDALVTADLAKMDGTGECRMEGGVIQR